ncbi:MAG: hypothetical protein HYY93_03860 [Planctomycetes bacterium]|nr:hypothetical protein [Planctomycetota bacterium]
MTTQKTVLIILAVVAAVIVTAVAAAVLFFVHVSQDVEGVGVDVKSPATVTVGDTFDLVVTVRNTRTGKDLTVSDVDIGESFLAGFTISSVNPEPKSSMRVPIEGGQSFTFDARIPAGGSRSFTFRLQAEGAGIYRGDVDVCEGLRFVTRMAQTVVEEKE